MIEKIIPFSSLLCVSAVEMSKKFLDEFDEAAKEFDAYVENVPVDTFGRKADALRLKFKMSKKLIEERERERREKKRDQASVGIELSENS